MKILAVILGAIVAVFVLIMPITAIMASQGLKNAEKPWAAGLVFNAARIRMRLFRYGSAARIMEAGLKQFPNLPDKPKVYYQIGLCHEKRGDTQLAKQWYQEYLKTWPTHPWASQARAHIEKIEAEVL